MDVSAILPLLLSKRNGKTDSSELLGELLKSSGAPPEMASVINAVRKGDDRKKAERFSPILGFVNDDILGKLTRWFS